LRAGCEFDFGRRDEEEIGPLVTEIDEPDVDFPGDGQVENDGMKNQRHGQNRTPGQDVFFIVVDNRSPGGPVKRDILPQSRPVLFIQTLAAAVRCAPLFSLSPGSPPVEFAPAL